MPVRLSKILAVAAIAFFASLVVFGNISDYATNFAFVSHVMAMDTIYPTARITYRAIHTPALQHAFYALIIAAEGATALLCWLGAYRLFTQRHSPAAVFNRAKSWATAGLTLGFLVWQVGFMSVGGEWFGMWMSSSWNGVPDAFRFFITIMAVLIYLNQRDVDEASQ